MPSGIIAPVYKSIVRATSDMIAEMNATGSFPPMEYMDWESRADEVELPKKTLLGIDGFSFKENEGLWLISFAFGLSSYKDANLLNEIEIIDWLQQRVGEKKKIKLLDVTDGTEISELMVTDFAMLPMAQSEMRNYRTIGMELKRTEIMRSRPQ